MASRETLEELLPAIDALNIDLKTIREDSYRRIGGNLETVLENIRIASQSAHVELTTLIVPGFNDSEEEMRELSERVAKIDPEIPLHVTRFFPAGEMRNTPPTPVHIVYHLAEIARNMLKYVYEGNV